MDFSVKRNNDYIVLNSCTIVFGNVYRIETFLGVIHDYHVVEKQPYDDVLVVEEPYNERGSAEHLHLNIAAIKSAVQIV